MNLIREESTTTLRIVIVVPQLLVFYTALMRPQRLEQYCMQLYAVVPHDYNDLCLPPPPPLLKSQNVLQRENPIAQIRVSQNQLETSYVAYVHASDPHRHIHTLCTC